MYPILGRYGPFFLYSYTVVLGLGLAAGIGLSAWFVKKEADGKLNTSRFHGWLDGLLVSLAAALVGGRVGFVWANWSYFQEAPDEIVLVWQGGLSYHGALVCGLLTYWLWCLWHRRNGRTQNSFTAYAALLMPGFVLAHLFGWLACWLEGCAFGREAVIGLFTADLPDSFGVFAVRYQSQLLGFGLTAIIFVAVLLLRKRLKEGAFLWLAFGLVSAGYGVVTLFRGDSVPLVGAFRLDTLMSVGLLLVSLVGFVLQFREKEQLER
jgi:phosphatidylglycerol:prolipoprotein diacylglycerol transferase